MLWPGVCDRADEGDNQAVPREGVSKGLASDVKSGRELIREERNV